MPSPKSPKEVRNEIVAFMTPFMSSPGARQAVVGSALWGESYTNNINYHVGAPVEFTKKLYDELWLRGGKGAIIAVLDELASSVGTDKRATIERLKADLNALPDNTADSGSPAQPQPPQQSGGQTFNIGGNVTGGIVNIGGTQHISGDMTVNQDDKDDA